MRRHAWQHLGAWSALALCGALGVGGALIAGLWLPASWAAVIGGGVTAVTAVWADRVKRWLDRQTEARQSIDGSTSVAGRGGGLPRAREAHDAVRLGVHPARQDEESPVAGALPPYVPRTVDRALREALRTTSCVVVVGESTAGKSRAAYEAMRAVLPDHRLAAPAGRDVLPALVTLLSRGGPSVLWLDDFERFLGPGGLTSTTVARLTGEGTVVLATMRTAEYDRFSARESRLAGDEERAALREGRGILQAARLVFMDRLWSPEELRAAEEHADDPRIAGALRQTEHFGLAEVLTAGPELLRDWRLAWSPGTHPRAAALVAAAVDCRRTGLDQPVSREILEELHDHYLSSRGGHRLRPEPLEEAWQWALTPVHGASSLLIPAGPNDEEPRFLAFDYLIDQPEHDPVPREVWTRLIAMADASQARQVANAAFWRVRTAFHTAVESGTVDDVYSRASALADRGERTAAIALLTEALEASQTGPDHGSQEQDAPLADKVTLRHQIAFYRMLAGQHAEAQESFRALLAECEARLPADDEYLQVIRHNLASCLRRGGDLPGALAEFRRILAVRERSLGPTAMNTLATRGVIADLTCDMGDPVEALHQAREILAAEEASLGKDHTNTLETRCAMAKFLAASGDHAAAAEALDACLPDLIAALGDDHPDVHKARGDLTAYRAVDGPVRAPGDHRS
ncbi:tetratricopeptide repeat protein [Streptomyces sp. NPDC050703]|uniref:tetratricopeptide repeat protein n=1 Tax=Streptomyces sp. NPDC050703 TaxID=3157218 RepID=UPI00342730AC